MNYITAHDGFTARDLVSHAQRHNWANGEEGRDGSGENHSWNNGAEGETDDAGINARRAADVRALLATLLLARGTPMLCMGDEAGRTQHGNNNAYAQDNALSGFDWAGMDGALRNYTARLVRARLRHPALHGAEALTERDVTWLALDGGALHDWHFARSLAMLLHGDASVLVVVHGAAEPATLHLPAPREGHAWRVVVDSSAPLREGAVGATEALAPRSVLLLEEVAQPGSATATTQETLRALAEAAGIAPCWHDLSGRETQVPRDTLQALLHALDLPAASRAQARESLALLAAPRALPAQLTVRQGEPFALPLARAGRVALLTSGVAHRAEALFVFKNYDHGRRK